MLLNSASPQSFLKPGNKTHNFPNSRQGPEQLCEEFQLQSKPFSTLPVAYPLKFTGRGARSSLAVWASPSPAPGAENATETNSILPAATAALLMCKPSPPRGSVGSLGALFPHFCYFSNSIRSRHWNSTSCALQISMAN